MAGTLFVLNVTDCCVRLFVPPIWEANVNEVCESVSCAGAAIVKVTGRFTDGAPAGEDGAIATEPVTMRAANRAHADAESKRKRGRLFARLVPLNN